MNSFAVQMSYASVERGDGSDPRAAAREILADLRVPAGIADGAAEWDESAQEAVVTIPVTDDAHVLTLTDDDHVATTLTAARLREIFADAGLTLWLHVDGSPDEDDADPLDWFDAAADDEEEGGDEEDDEVDPFDDAEFEADPLQIAVFSHRGPFAARMVAQLNGWDVVHIESGAWSLLRAESGDPADAGIVSKEEMPVIELNRVADGGSWFEITTPGGAHMFWPDAERGTVPVLDLDAVAVPETAEICRRLLTDGEGSRDELAAVAAHSRLDVDAAHRALQPESLGGVVGERARFEAFLAAFGIPSGLIAAAFDDDHGLDVQRFAPEGWGPLIGEVLVDGMPAMTPLTRRERPFARFVRGLRRRPSLAAALSVAELTIGVAATRRRGVSRFVGILLIIDAIGDLVLGVVRARRGR